MKAQFLIHNKQDNVGVAVVDIKVGDTVIGVCLEDQSQVSIEANDNIPLGHKIATTALKEGSNVIKYGVPVGHATKPILPGQHVHVHNLKSNRW